MENSIFVSIYYRQQGLCCNRSFLKKGIFPKTFIELSLDTACTRDILLDRDAAWKTAFIGKQAEDPPP